MTVVDFSSSGAANDSDMDNIIQPFQLESSSLRGRVVRLGSVLEDIISAHDYPEIVSQILAEAITLGLLLTSMLKTEGIFTLQTSGDGIIPMLVVDITTAGDVRGYASFDEKAVKKVKSKDFKELLGKGYLAFTIDQVGDTDRYQGIVELKGESLTDCAQNYFDQSEQIGTAIQLSATRHGGKWRSGGIMLQHMPEHGEYARNKTEIRELKKDEATTEDDDPIRENWNRASVLLQSCTEEELTSPGLSTNMLLTRLFHEEGVRVYTPTSVQKKCRCSRERIENILKQMEPEDLKEAAEEGVIQSQCEFCSKEYSIEISQIIS